jgi:hypothetical protein
MGYQEMQDKDGILIQDGVTLTGCQKNVLALIEWLNAWGKENRMVFVVSSAFRTPEANVRAGGSPNSGHCRGLAVDFSFQGVNVFKITSALFGYYESQVGPWNGATEFEVCRGKGQQHFHIAFIPEKEMVSFTGAYR